MSTFFRFLYEFLLQFFSGFITMIKGFFTGIAEIFTIKNYISVINFYKDDFTGPEWLFVVLAILLVLIISFAIIFLLYLLIKKYLRFRKTIVEQENLLEEVATLNNEVATLMQEKQDILAMKVSHLGIKPNEEDVEEESSSADAVAEGEGIRFPKLYSIDEEFANYKIQNYGNNFSLPELVELFRNFAAS